MNDLVIGICDDLEEERLALSRMVRSYAQERGMPVRLRLFSSGTELLEASPRQRDFQILFLDIFMPGLSGMDAARQLRRDGVNAAIIFATTSLDHGLDSFEVQSADYLVKPFQKQDVAQALDWCLAHLPEPLRCLSVYSEGETQEIPLASICYIEVLGHQSHIYTTRQEITARQGLDALEAAISSQDFLRCHRSFLVNMNHIQKIEGSDFRMTTGARVPISTSNLARIRNAFIDWTYYKAWSKP